MNYELKVRREFEEFPHVFVGSMLSSLAWCGLRSAAHHGDHGVASTSTMRRTFVFITH